MSVQNEKISASGSAAQQRQAAEGVYASLFDKINLSPVSRLSDLNVWQDSQAMSDASADERVTAAMQVFLTRLKISGARVDKLDKHLLDHHIAELDYQISRQLDAVMHHDEFQQVESVWRGLKSLVDKIDFRQNVKRGEHDVSKGSLRRDYEDAPKVKQSGQYRQTYVAE